MDLLLNGPNRRQVFALLFSVLCVIGAFFQVSQLAFSYFQYQTTSVVEIVTGTSYKPQTLNMCIRYTDILNYSAIRETNTSRSDWERTTEPAVVREMQQSLSAREIFLYTPEPRETITSAKFRRANSFEQHSCNSSDCYSLFYTGKYIYLEYICYFFRPLINQSMSSHSISVTPSAAGQIFSIKLKSVFNDSIIYRICFDALDSLPYQALPLAPVKKRSTNSDSEQKSGNGSHQHPQLFNSIITSFNQLRTDLLPPPYDTQCEYYTRRDFISRAHCIQDCMNSSVYDAMKKVPFSVIVNRSIDAHILSYHDLSENHVTAQLLLFENSCRSKCSRLDCHSILTLTEVHEEAGDEITVFLHLSSAPFTKITALKQIELVEFLASAMSSFSTWTGIAIISFNPIAFYYTVKCYIERNRSQVKNARIQQKRDHVRDQLRQLSDSYSNGSMLQKPVYLATSYISPEHNVEVARLMAKNRIMHQLYKDLK